MNISSALQTGLNGMQNSQAEIQKSADQIVRSGTVELSGTVEKDSTSSLDIAEPIVNMKIEQQIFDASAKMVKTADEMLGTVMDIKA